MSTVPRAAARGPSTYVDSLDATTDHSQALVAPMLRDRTVLLVPAGYGDTPFDATFVGSLVVTAGKDFDGVVTLEVVPLASAWVPTLAYADLPDDWAATPVTWTGTLLAGQTASFNVGTFGTTYASDGTVPYGFAIRRTDTGTQGALYTMRADNGRAPTLLGGFTFPADEPSGIVPNGNRIVGVPKPVVKADQPDGDDMVSQQWQLGLSGAYDAGDGLDTPTWDSLEVPSAVFQLDTSTTTVTFPGFPLSTSGTPTRYLTCRWKDADGTWSKWAPPVPVGGYLPQPAATITDPSGGFTGDGNPAYAWAVGFTQTRFQVVTTLADSTAVLDDSGQQPSAVTAYQPNPDGRLGTGHGHGFVLRAAEPVTGLVRTWDDEDRVATPGCPIYGEATVDFRFTSNDAIPTVDSVALRQVGSSPWVDFLVLVSGDARGFDRMRFEWGPDTAHAEQIMHYRKADLPAPEDVEGSDLYTVRFWGAQPWQPGYVGGIRLIFGPQTGGTVWGVLDALEVHGEWAGDADPDSLTYGVLAAGTGENTRTGRTDQVAIINALNEALPMVQWGSEGPMVLSLGGVIEDFAGVTASEWQRAWRRLSSKGRIVQYARGDVSYPVVMFGYSVDEVLDYGNVFMKQYTASAVQLDFASYADEPPTWGAPDVTTYDFEFDVEGDPTVAGDEILKAVSPDGSPGVIDVDGHDALYVESPLDDAGMAADLGWRG